MRKLIITGTAAAALFMVEAAAAPRAHAVTATAPAGLNLALPQADFVQQAAYVCRPAWRCGFWGCGWRQACWWQPGPQWRHRHWQQRPWGWHWRHRRW